MSRMRWVGGFSLALAASALALACGDSEEPDGGGGSDLGGADGSGGGDTGGPASGGTSPVGEDVVDACAAPSGPGTDVPASIDTDETWTPEGSPYRVTSNLYLTATLTLEPCTVVQIDEGVNLFVGNEPELGSIVAHGTAEEVEDGTIELRGILFERLDAGGAWASIAVDSTGSLDFEWVIVDGGGSEGAAQRGGGAILSYGVSPFGEPTENVRLLQTFVVGSETYGINLQNRAAFTEDSSDVFVLESGGQASPYGVFIEAGAVHSLPEGLVLAGNVSDEVLVEPFTTVFEDTFPDRDVPLRVNGALYLQADPDQGQSGTATLTIEPGTEVRFAESAGSGIYLGTDADRPGAIVADGTAENPILLRSAEEEPAAGDWLGLYFRYTISPGNVLSHVTIQHAGAQSGAQGYGCGPIENHASILVLTEQPIAPFIENCTFEDAGGDTQILLGWSEEADPDGAAASYFEGNTFASAPDCRVSLPRDVDNACPGNDAEPDCL